MTYPKPTIIAAINAARAQTNWPEASLIIDTAAMILAGHQADDATLDAARDQVRAEMGLDWQAQAEVEG